MLLGQPAGQNNGKAPSWRYGQFGPGGGSVPHNVMSTGAIAPFDPRHARHDISGNFVQDATRIPVGFPGVSQQVTSGPGGLNGVLLGAAPDGRPTRQFDMDGNPNAIEAQAVAAGAARVAQIMRQQGLLNLPSQLIGGPLSSLARGEAVVLRWPNGVAVGTSA